MTQASLKRSIRLINRKAERALRAAVAGLIRERQRTGESVVLWRNGKVVRVPAAQLLRRPPGRQAARPARRT